MPPALRANYDHSWRNDAGSRDPAPVLSRPHPPGKDSLAPISAPSAVTTGKAIQRAPYGRQIGPSALCGSCISSVLYFGTGVQLE